MPVKLAEPLHAELRDHLFARKMIRPDPRNARNATSSALVQLMSAIIGIGREPAFQLRANFVQVPSITSESECLREHHQMLMPIRLPDHLVIAAVAGIQVRNAPEITADRFPFRWIDRGAKGFRGQSRWSGPGWGSDAARICSARRHHSLGERVPEMREHGSGSGSLMRGLEIRVELHLRRPVASAN